MPEFITDGLTFYESFLLVIGFIVGLYVFGKFMEMCLDNPRIGGFALAVFLIGMVSWVISLVW